MKAFMVCLKECDDYFVNKHRNNERRGIGGIFLRSSKTAEKHI